LNYPPTAVGGIYFSCEAVSTRAEESLVCEDKARSTITGRWRPCAGLLMVFERKRRTSVGFCY